jgi:hypothetical protein
MANRKSFTSYASYANQALPGKQYQELSIMDDIGYRGASSVVTLPHLGEAIFCT